MAANLSLDATIDNAKKRTSWSWRDFKSHGRIKKMRAEKEERRKDMYHITTHRIALLTISTFLIVLTLKVLIVPDAEIPESFISIVSTVIGFYFARSFFSK